MIQQKESQQTDDNFAAVIYGGTAASGEDDQARGQSWTVGGSDYTIAHVFLKLFKNGSPADNLQLEVVSGSINGSVVGTSDLFSAASVVSGSANHKFVFSGANRAKLTSGTKYYFRLTRTGVRDTSNYIQWYNTEPGSGLSLAGFYNRSNNTWSGEDTRDHRFIIGGSSVNMPGNMQQFIQVGNGMSRSERAS